jgi:hypothetical protein
VRQYPAVRALSVVAVVRRSEGEIKLPEVALRAEGGSSPVHELVPAQDLGDCRYRLLQSPGLVEGLAAGDEVKVSGDGSFEILQRFGNLVVWVFGTEPSVLSQLEEQLTPLVARIGGCLDGGTRLSLIYTIPVTVGFGRIEAVFKSVVDEPANASWMFSNVYGPDGKTPLEWWRDRMLPIWTKG